MRSITNDYIFEPKIDGHRLILSHTNGETRLFTRHNNDCTRQYPELLSVPFMDDIILDGEIACVDPDTGAISFESVMERFSAKKADKVRRLSEQLPANYIVFDVLRYKGVDLRGLPLKQRKEVLGSIPFLMKRVISLRSFARANVFYPVESKQIHG